MAQNILIAFDDSENAMRAVKFVAESFNKDSRITLFHVLQDPATLFEIQSPELTEYYVAQRSSFSILETQKRKLIETVMAKAATFLTESGFASDRVNTQIAAKKIGIARDIIEMSQAGFDMVVMGRRGLSAIKEFFLGSVSQKVFNSAKDITVVIVN